MFRLYCVVIGDRSSPQFVEFYWAEDGSHAKEQAINAYPTSNYGPVTLVPYVKPREEAPTS